MTPRANGIIARMCSHASSAMIRTCHIRHVATPISRNIATRMDVVFEEILPPDLEIERDQPALLGGWFRSIVLRKVTMA